MGRRPQLCASNDMALQLNPRRHVEERRGLKGSAWGEGSSDTRTPASESKHFIQRLGEERLESSRLSAVLNWAELAGLPSLKARVTF